MSRYVGETYRIPLEEGGFNYNKNVDTVPPSDFVHPSINLWMNEGGIRKRGGTAIVDTSASMDGSNVTGIFDFLGSSQYLVRATANGKLWSDVATTFKTGWTADQKVHFMQWDDELYCCNGADTPTVWSEATISVDMTTIPSDWTGTNFPSQMIQHGSSNSLRNWAIGCPSTPKTVYVTPDGTPKDFSDVNVLTFFIETGDGYGIVGGVEYGDRLVLFGKTKSFIMNDTDTNTDNWGYTESQWYGGAATWRLIVRTPNDIVCMMEDGEIYSVSSAETYGDYKAASLIRPSYMQEWIKTYVNLAYINDFHGIYDPVLRAVKIFVVRNGQTEVDTALCYFIDRPPEKAWTILGNHDYESGYSALSSCRVRVSAGSWKIYTGGYNGQVWRLGEVNRNDNSAAFVSRYRTTQLAFDNVRDSKRYDRMRLVATQEGSCDASVRSWIDGDLQDVQTLEFATSGAYLGAFVLGTDVLGGVEILEDTISIGRIGKRIAIEIANAVANEDFFFSQLMIDFLPIGKLI